jgi:hypothetical protein
MATTLLNSLRLAGNEARHLGNFQAVMHVVDVRRRTEVMARRLTVTPASFASSNSAEKTAIA